jgi:ABC-type nickel/cobalt efflux system permease component RcnA
VRRRRPNCAAAWGANGLHTLLTDRIGGFAQTRNLAVLVSMLPFGIAFGTVHALTPGHAEHSERPAQDWRTGYGK